MVLLSADAGETWTYAIDASAAEPGNWLPESSPYFQSDVGTGDESYLLSTPAKAYPEGEYLLRVECYHAERELHYGYHERTFQIRRKPVDEGAK